MRGIIEILGEAILLATFQHAPRRAGLSRNHNRSTIEPDGVELGARCGRLGPHRAR